ncbi:putative type I restriction-modification system, S subunit [Candidatus Protofrankia californiensis]|uniref:Putative type I restriction-modification system, S subunit n=1 Tax=Candidatus Protofrankia californiensis TaxID=1839754 RepID=A0A1C3NWG2_9ACTN|nr:putative type I restriction-modification system, S subunit [Candidatus Protofrankia californiensis]
MSADLDIALPNSWAWLPIKFATTFLNRGTAPDYIDDGPVRVISQAANQAFGLDWQRTRFHDYDGDPRKLKGYLFPNDIIINSTGTGTLGRVGYFTSGPDELPCVADGHVTVARADRQVAEPRYMYYWLSCTPFYDFIYSSLTVGATNQIELNRERLAGAPIALPPLDEQRRIADFLDAETAGTDLLVDAIGKRLSLLEARRRALLMSVFPDFDCVKNRLGYHLNLVTSGPRGWGDYVGPYGSPFFRSANLRRNGIEPNLETLALVGPPTSAAAEAARSRIRAGDVLIGITGANTAWVSLADQRIDGANVSQHVCLARPGKTIDGRWLAYALSAPQIQELLLGSQYGGTKIQLSLGDIRNLIIPLPSVKDQQIIAARISDGLANISAEQEIRDRQLALLTERRQALITAAVTGQIDVTTARGFVPAGGASV